ncbi:REDY-like protein HapK [Novosphingobium mangrovi (ex Hu et al. 2023)]|uniref:REDY-like protein HapK n=1 Tax=Novosphingobium mangrovi (ex Hu et al. 2023) TaxID=2930094 RepID=A0ABT0A9P8_9SPHN|nr:REDY-like protein HapK [Novosphingobium mangrovi (ex Hu et al. 2023)]MCJ1959926.1 REDY-like protein HapK [Novosphingobium mangrovi (ex Hu et al. 2023)]
MIIFAVFNLKSGVSVEEYEAWARETDLPTANSLKSIDSFRVYRSTSVLGSDEKPPFGYIEVLDVNDMEQFAADAQSEIMQEVAATFQGMVDVTFVMTEELVA